jgi:alanine racemase
MSATITAPTERLPRPVPRLVIDLNAMKANYARLCEMAQRARVGAVVKADAYGLGARRVAPALWSAGCRHFYVAHAFEGEAVRAALEDRPAEIFVFNGFWRAEIDLLRQSDLTPVINTPEQISELRDHAGDLPFALHLDTGMNRLGLDAAQTEVLLADTSVLDGLRLRQVISHLSCADEPAHEMNRRQRETYERISAAFPGVGRSFSNSAGALLGEDFHFDVLRPGLALCGAPPDPARPNPFTPVATIEAPILQIRRLEPGDPVGYGASWVADEPRMAATVATGYADGILRACGDGGYGRVFGEPVPILGRISMDLITVDITAMADRVAPGDMVRFLGEDLQPLSDAASTIPFELLVRLGARFDRRYLDED